jgi:L-lysine 2,3-aminomutase
MGFSNPAEAQTEHMKRKYLNQQQILLFRHLCAIFCQLCERIEWTAMESSDRRRLRRPMAGLAACINVAQIEIGTKKRRASKTTKATFRKR